MTGRLLRQDSLTAVDRDNMYRLLDAHFLGVDLAGFDRDLRAKSHAVLIERDGKLLGFSTLLAYRSSFEAEQITVIYSGDTIVSMEAWGSAAFPRAWIHSVYKIRDEFGSAGGRLIWLLLTSGFRTYRFLPVFFSEFYPTFERPTPGHWQALLSSLATAQFGKNYLPTTGVVVLPNPQPLRGALQVVPTARLADPHVQYFLSRNPGHTRGDELACITDLSPANLTPAGRRMVYGSSGEASP